MSNNSSVDKAIQVLTGQKNCVNQIEYEAICVEQKNIFNDIQKTIAQCDTKTSPKHIPGWKRQILNDRFEEYYQKKNNYLLEQTYINFNQDEICRFMSLRSDILPIGTYMKQTIENYLHTIMSRDMVNEVIDYFKVINIEDVHDKYNTQYHDKYINKEYLTP